ncbi:hypothetical protein ACIPF8_16915 [Collimonas sp. NPDC087041]|uniref:hypothetical protein n=1 Tax=Collimonas sp. NPDC087041 TaxID=3363960 RepID=UPI00380DB660
MTYCTTSWLSKLFLKTPFPHEPCNGFIPDIMMTNGHTVNLLDFGGDGVVRHTGGHTPGSIAVELSSQDMMVGDLIASGILIGGVILKGRAIRPPFEDDPATVSRELIRMVESGGKRFHMGHGGPLDFWTLVRCCATPKLWRSWCAIHAPQESANTSIARAATPINAVASRDYFFDTPWLSSCVSI